MLQAQAISMAVHELGMNSTKYGAISRANGKLSILGICCQTAGACFNGRKSASLGSLEYLDMQELRGDGVLDLSPLANLKNLRHLDIYDNAITDISALAALDELETLNAFGTDITDLSPLQNITALNTIHIQATPVSDVTPLAQITSLTAVYLNGTDIKDISPLIGLPRLSFLDPPSGPGIVGHENIQNFLR